MDVVPVCVHRTRRTRFESRGAEDHLLFGVAAAECAADQACLRRCDRGVGLRGNTYPTQAQALADSQAVKPGISVVIVEAGVSSVNGNQTTYGYVAPLTGAATAGRTADFGGQFLRSSVADWPTSARCRRNNVTA
jgi:hypothetical protein